MAEHGRSGGPKSKDVSITEGFNRSKKGMSKAEQARAKREAKARELADAEKRKSAEGELDRLADRAAKLRDQLGLDAELEPENAGTARVDDADASSDEMIRDLRWAYRTGLGKRKLKEMMKDDKLGLPLIRELVKVEVAYLTAKLRQKEELKPEQQQQVFVVIRGLEDEKKFDVEVSKGEAVDMRQIQHALNPDGTEYEH